MVKHAMQCAKMWRGLRFPLWVIQWLAPQSPSAGALVKLGPLHALSSPFNGAA